MQQLLQMGQQLQSKMGKLQEDLEQKTFKASSGGGMVTASVDGKGSVRRVEIDPTVVDPEDVEMLEDLVLAAVSEAQSKARGAYEEEVKKMTGGLPMQLPGIL